MILKSSTLNSRALPLSVILLIALAVHGPLLLMQVPAGSYDANVHIFFAQPLRAALVQSLESEVVRRLLGNYLSSSGAPVDSPVLAHHGAATGVHVRPAYCHLAAAGRHVPLRADLGG